MQAEDKLDEPRNDGIDMSDNNNQYLTFFMAEEEYGVDILSVQEIRGWDSVTPIPKSPPHVKGVINLRGTIVPIIDLRLRFGIPAVEYGPVTVVIVLKVNGKDGENITGIVVDAVSDVYSIDENDIKTPPDLGDSVDISYIRGLVNVDEKMVVLLEHEKMLNMQELADLGDLSRMMSKAS